MRFDLRGTYMSTMTHAVGVVVVCMAEEVRSHATPLQIL